MNSEYIFGVRSYFLFRFLFAVNSNAVDYITEMCVARVWLQRISAMEIFGCWLRKMLFRCHFSSFDEILIGK